MNFDEFIGQVQSRGRMASQDEALKATRATLGVLGQRLAGGEASDLAAQLPEEIARFLHSDGGTGERFDLDEFFRRVSEREGVDLPVSVHHARAVISVLQEAVSRGEMQDVRAQLPEDFAPLFEAGSEGEMTRNR
ncbi:MAG TPA: DUF2267 domain-containing protein [Chloroflexi bacterium]|jgi:uncharacterized protein (DUF2267 family)|nr:DUF2267 domain-containing protein [Chloroflexota bacterium]